MTLLLMKILILSLEWRYDKKHRERNQKMENRYCNIIFTKIIIAILTITIVTERDIGFAIT